MLYPDDFTTHHVHHPTTTPPWKPITRRPQNFMALGDTTSAMKRRDWQPQQVIITASSGTQLLGIWWTDAYFHHRWQFPSNVVHVGERDLVQWWCFVGHRGVQCLQGKIPEFKLKYPDMCNLRTPKNDTTQFWTSSHTSICSCLLFAGVEFADRP